MERIEISNPNVSLSDIVKHVSRDRISVELSDGQVPLAIIVPIDKPTTMADLDRALRACTRLGDDAEAFSRDVLSVRQSIGELDDRAVKILGRTLSADRNRISHGDDGWISAEIA